MKTTKEMIEVMQAFEIGEQIEIMNKFGEWIYIDKPIWNWAIFDYRVKPKPKYVPFETAEEFLEAQREHGIETSTGEQLFINSDNRVYVKDDYRARSGKCSFEYLFNKFKFVDGTPCGKEVEV